MAIGTTNFPTSLDTATELIRAANDARGVIATGGATNSATTINITSVPSSAPADGIAVIVSATDDTVREIVSYTGKTSTTITGVTRNLESSGAKTWLAGDVVYFDVLTALSRSVLVNALIALETKLGTGADTPASGEVLKATGAGASGWSSLASSDVSGFAAAAGDSVRVIAYSSTSVTASNSGTTYATYLSTTLVLPAGTWECTTICWGSFTSATTNSFADMRVELPAASSGAIDGVGSAFARITLRAGSQTSVVSDGVTATTFRSQFRWNNTGVAASMTGLPGVLVAICRRTA